MSSSPLYVAFLWHMHQPYYKDPFTGIYRLPWVRLHGTKDYLDMALELEAYPEIRQTFNLVPSLIEQILDYTDNKGSDAFLEVTRKRASDLTPDDRAFILGNFFLANWDTMVKPFPRYFEILSKRGFSLSRADLSRTIKYFTDSDFLDLQVLFNLVWIDPMFRDKDPFLKELLQKSRGYSEEEKNLLIEKQFSILKGIIPKYKELSDKGQIEISTTPFYHPILPLLWNTDNGRVSSPDIRLPKRKFSYPEDARQQIQAAINYFVKIFGSKPSGMWPSEGSVCEDVIKAIHEQGISWVATDEDVLSRSLNTALRGSSGSLLNPDMLYSAYDFSGASIIFRDHKLSDLLGFVYSGWDPKFAAQDLINRLTAVHDSLPKNEPHIVPIILDGENAWEYYRNDGHDFFRYLYEGLSNNDRLKTATVSGFLKETSRRKTLDRLHAGSWINANYNVWIGHEEDNAAWDYLSEARDTLQAFKDSNPGGDISSALKAVYVAEGSDWNWWYGDEHSTETAKEFDELFRLNLMKIYKEIGKDIPAHLHVPILREDRAASPSVEIRGFIHPKIDGIMTSYFEWINAAYMEVGRSGGSMHMSESLISRIYYGFSQDNLFVRIDPKESFAAFPADTVFSIEIMTPHCLRVDIPLKKPDSSHLMSKCDETWTDTGKKIESAIDDILECSIPFDTICAKDNDELNISITLRKNGNEIERCPWRGYVKIIVPNPDFEAMMWY